MKLLFYAFLMALYSCPPMDDCNLPKKWVYKIDAFSMSGEIYDTSEEVVVVDSIATEGETKILFLSNGYATEYLGCDVQKHYAVSAGKLNMVYDTDMKNITYPFSVRSLDDEITTYNLSTTYQKDTVLSNNMQVKMLSTPATLSMDSTVTYLMHTTYFSDSLGMVGRTFYDERGKLSSIKRLLRVEY